MKEQSIIEVGESRPVWESLEGFARQGVQRFYSTSACRGASYGGAWPGSFVSRVGRPWPGTLLPVKDRPSDVEPENSSAGPCWPNVIARSSELNPDGEPARVEVPS